MEIPSKLIVLGALGCAVAGGLIEHRFNSSETITTQYVDRDVVKFKVITTTHEVDRPDGSKIIDSTKTDDSIEQKKVVDTIIDKKAAQVPNWLAAAGMGLNNKKEKIYSLSIDRRILGPISIGAYGSTDSELGLRLGVGF